MGCCSFEATPATHRGASTTVSPRVDYADVRRACADMELHAILEDSFASQYLLAFAQSELSEEGVCFVLAAHEFKRAVAEFNPVRALELGRKICETHLMPGSDLDINAAVPTQKAATRWLRQYAKDPKASPPVEVIRGAHRIGYRAVAFDVLPRFRQSKFCEELCALHLSRQLSNVARRALLDPHLDARAQSLVRFWVESKAFETGYTTLASGWPAEGTVQARTRLPSHHPPRLQAPVHRPREPRAQHAQTVAAAHSSLLEHEPPEGIGLADDARVRLTRRLPEAPLALFREAQLGAINAMCGWYSSFLESEAGTAYAEAIGVDLLPKVAKRWKADADNYAADW